MSSMNDDEMSQLYYEARILGYAERVGALKSKLHTIMGWAYDKMKETEGREKAQWNQIYTLCQEGLTYD